MRERFEIKDKYLDEIRRIREHASTMFSGDDRELVIQGLVNEMWERIGAREGFYPYSVELEDERHFTAEIKENVGRC